MWKVKRWQEISDKILTIMYQPTDAASLGVVRFLFGKFFTQLKNVLIKFFKSNLNKQEKFNYIFSSKNCLIIMDEKKVLQ